MSKSELAILGQVRPTETTLSPNPHVVRQEQLGRLLGVENRGRLRMIEPTHKGVIPLIPIHHDSRVPTIGHTLASLALQGYDGPMPIVIADNGLSDSGGREVKSMAESLGLSVDFADAKPESSFQRNAAHARNRGLSFIQEQGRERPEYRAGGVLLLDSDTALTAGSLRELEETFRRHEDAVAVTAANISVPKLDPADYTVPTNGASRQREVLLPIIYSNGAVDIASIVAFGSDIAAKTTGVLIDREVLERLGKPFVVFPYGSAEDMAFSAMLNSYGRTYYNPNARLLDQARESAILTRQQRAKWGRDHVVLWNDLVSQGLVPQAGIHVLEPENSRWVEWIVPNTEQFMGVVVNPRQLRALGYSLLNKIDQEGSQSYSDDISRYMVICGLRTLREVISQVNEARDSVPKVERVDLPRPVQPDRTQTRFSEDALTGLLAGNIMGIHDIQEFGDQQASPKTFLYGVRQAASYSR